MWIAENTRLIEVPYTNSSNEEKERRDDCFTAEEAERSVPREERTDETQEESGGGWLGWAGRGGQRKEEDKEATKATTLQKIIADNGTLPRGAAVCQSH